MSTRACAICANSNGNRSFTAREMMFGLRERFEYLACEACGCLQLLDVPRDLSRFYPRNYYSLGAASALDRSLAIKLRKLRARVLLRVPARVIDALVQSPWVHPVFAPTEFCLVAGLHLKIATPMSDLGSGSGGGLVLLANQGFCNLTGFDPYVEHDLQIGAHIWVHKLGLEEMPGGWDVIMLNHSFEHMTRPHEVLEGLRTRLREQGRIVIRMPIADSWAWRNYGVDWVQLDAPRHLFIHTQRSLHLLAERAGLEVSRVFFDSTSFQFWGSEQYRRDIPLRDPRSYLEDGTGLFTATEIRGFHRRAQRLNRQRAGDSAGFVLRVRDRVPAPPRGQTSIA